ncbi:MAG: hypothetical protein BYD32DRAFT_460894 [Podila humilis]|nr:MAG: hypothetical protein BYD32DRAFT_460894 [Podila humilis]
MSELLVLHYAYGPTDCGGSHDGDQNKGVGHGRLNAKAHEDKNEITMAYLCSYSLLSDLSPVTPNSKEHKPRFAGFKNGLSDIDTLRYKQLYQKEPHVYRSFERHVLPSEQKLTMLFKLTPTILLITLLALAPVMAKKKDTPSDSDEDTSSENTPIPSKDDIKCPSYPTPCPATVNPICIVDGHGKFARFLNSCEFERATACGQVQTILHTLYLCPDPPQPASPQNITST